MFANLISFLSLFGLIVVFGWSTRQAWILRLLPLKWLFSVLSGLVTLLFMAITAIGLVGFSKTVIHPNNPVHVVSVAADQTQIARGKSLAGYCAVCHADQEGSVLLNGKNKNLLSIPDGPVAGEMYAPNLTPAGEISTWTDGELIRAIREGVHKNGRPLLIMPSEYFKHLSDEDAMAIVAYLRSQTAATNSSQVDSPSNHLNLIGYLIIGSGLFHTSVQDPIILPIAGPQPGITAEYGDYLIYYIGCRDCHGMDFSGGVTGGLYPKGPNLTAIVPHWTDDQFMETIRTGIDPGGHTLNSAIMPWKEISSAMSDDDLKAIYTYLHSLPLTVAKQY